MQIAHYSHLSVRRYTYPYAIFNGLSGKAVAKRPRARFSCCTTTTNLGETFREGEDSTLPGFRAPISTIHARRFGNGQYYENTSGLDVQAKWKGCTTPPTSATRGGSTRSPAMRTRPICSAVLPRRTTAARWFKSRFARRWMPPTIVYSAALCVVGLPFVIMRPGALRWAPSFVVLAGLSFLAAWLRRERSLWGNDGRDR